MSSVTLNEPTPNSQPTTLPQLWDVNDCANFLKRSPRWLWSAISLPCESPGSIPHFRIGASPRFFPEEIVAWVRAGCPPAASIAAQRAAIAM